MTQVVFLGSGPFAVPILERLARLESQLHVITRPDRPAGRGRKLVTTPVGKRAIALGLHVEAPATVNDDAIVERLKALGPRLILVADYGEMLRAPLRAVPSVGIFNLHASLLPELRGAAPVVHALLRGDTRTGVTLFRIESGLDSGPIVDRVETAIGESETSGELEARLAGLAAELVEKDLAMLLAGTFIETPQDASRATPAPKLSRGAWDLSWEQPARSVVDFIRAMSPRPGAQALLRLAPGGEALRVKLLRSRLVAAKSATDLGPGTVSGIEKHTFRVAAIGGEIEVLEIQPAGRALQSASEFLRGHPLTRESRFERIPSGTDCA